MAQGRGEAKEAAMAVGLVMIALLLLNSQLVESKVVVVGGSLGWTYNAKNWPNGQNFQAGDILEFRYPVGVHNVVEVDAFGYERCRFDNVKGTYSSGIDRIKLMRGTTYFACSLGKHCIEGNMRIKVTAV